VYVTGGLGRSPWRTRVRGRLRCSPCCGGAPPCA